MIYGLPYIGSKNLIAKTLIDALPAATTFVDLFAGGCAMTHAAMLSNKYQNFIANDLSDTPQLFLDSVAGKFADEKRWISPMPTGFHEVLAIPHRSRLSATANNAVVERLYCNHPRQRFGQLDFLGQLFAEAV